MCIALWKEIEEWFNVLLESVVTSNTCINSKLTTWERKFETTFHGGDIPFNYCSEATTILKGGNVYKKGRKYYPHVFVKELKVTELNTSAKLSLDGSTHALHFRVKTTN